MTTLDEDFPERWVYESALKSEICSHCIHFMADGQCITRGLKSCPIFNNLPELIQIVRTTNSLRMDPYVARVRESICATCHHQKMGKCSMRLSGKCPLERYMPLVVNIIKDVSPFTG